MKPIIDAQELFFLYQAKEEIILIDATNNLTAKEDYKKEHLVGALFVDMNIDLSCIGESAVNGGRHPLPSPLNFTKTLQALGITPESHVIIYDKVNGANAAARFWWMLVAIGHSKVQVLNGGLQAAIQAGFPIDDNKVVPTKVPLYPVIEWQLPLAMISEVERNVQEEDYLVIDVRETQRYGGKSEPIDIIAGHIPGAINIPFTLNLDAQGLFLNDEVLRSKYEIIFKSYAVDRIVVHCGSGVTACHTLLAITAAGLPTPKLYVGSWSEWSRNNKSIAIGE
ncbi:MAG: sulfurtransferase [Flavobacteriaceae bacterium]|jgi:thiosulfate/3-mercaptopyruvate sulfurtransferase|nr:sulfurtransferase [Flavobacteriaceae bacterium]